MQHEKLPPDDEMLRALVRDAPLAMVALDTARHVRVWNKAAEAIFGWREEEVLGRPLPHVPVGKQAEHDELTGRAVEGARPQELALSRLTKSGASVDVRMSSAPLRDFDNRVIGLLATYESAQQAGEAPAGDATAIPFRGLVEQSIVGLYVIQDGYFQYVNPRYAQMYGYTEREMVGTQPVLHWVLADDHAMFNENMRRRLTGEVQSIRYRLRGLHRDGRLIDMEAHGTRFSYRGRPAVIGVQIDVSEQARVERELRESETHLRELTAHLQRVREDQRRRIAREIHDVLGGTLTALRMDLEWSQRNLARNEADGVRLADMLNLADEALETVRKVSADLRPGVLDNLGLIAAIDWQAREFRRRTGVDGRLDIVPLRLALDETRATAIFRIFQEALTNVARHAGATQVDIGVRMNQGDLEIAVDDNGSGITTDQIRSRSSYGIMGMFERAREIGAVLELAGRADGGTRMRLRCAISATELGES